MKPDYRPLWAVSHNGNSHAKTNWMRKRWLTILVTVILTTAANYLMPHYAYVPLQHGWIKVNTWTGKLEETFNGQGSY